MAAVPSIGRASLVESDGAAAEAIATHELYERHAGRIHAYCQHQLGSREEAEDALQTVFMNAFRALRKGVVPEAETAWLYKIAENVCLSRRRSSWRRNRIESPADFDVIEEIVPGPSRQRDELIGIEDALAAMPEQQRRAILLREWQGLSYREIGDELELSQSAVETLIFRARRSLAQGLSDPHRLAPAKQGRLRRARRVLDLTSLLGAAKSFLLGSAALKATTAAVAVTAVAGGVTVAPQVLDPKPKPPLAVLDAPPLRPVVPTPTRIVHSAAVPTALDGTTDLPAAAALTPAAVRATRARALGAARAPRAAAKPPLSVPARPGGPSANAADRAGPKAEPPGRAAAPKTVEPKAAKSGSKPANAVQSKPVQAKAKPKPAKAAPQRGATARTTAPVRAKPKPARAPAATSGEPQGSARKAAAAAPAAAPEADTVAAGDPAAAAAERAAEAQEREKSAAKEKK